MSEYSLLSLMSSKAISNIALRYSENSVGVSTQSLLYVIDYWKLVRGQLRVNSLGLHAIV